MSEDVRIQDHPDYPLSGQREQTQAAKWQQSFVARKLLAPGEDDLLDHFLRWTRRYAFLEQIVQGEIRYELPVHHTVTSREGMAVLAEEGERFARAELELMGDPDVPALEILDRLEEQGVKVITRVALPVIEKADRLVGFFFFDGSSGPAFGALASREDPRTPLVLAHLLGHLVLDIDPYRNRVCAWDGDLRVLDKDPVEERADRFARAFLMPESRVRTVLDQIAGAIQAGETPVARMHELLCSIFEIPPALLDWRLQDLGLTVLRDQLRRAAKDGRPNGRPTNGSASEVPAVPRRRAAGLVDRFELPERYLNLALACCHEKLMDAGELARFLEVNVEDAQRLLDEAGIDAESRE